VFGSKAAEERCEMKRNLERLKQLNGALAEEIEVVAPPSSLSELNLPRGHGFAWGLLKSSRCAVAKVFLSAGAVFPLHLHTEWEMLLVYEGEVVLEVEGERRAMGMRDMAMIEPGMHHALPEVIQNTYLLAVTIPPAACFPRGVHDA